MTRFKYELRTPSGNRSSGVLEAHSQREASELLANHGEVMSISPVSSPRASLLKRMRSFSVNFGPSRQDVYDFTNQLAVMISAGLNIRDAIGGIAEEVENPKFRKILFELRADVEAGRPFSAALAEHPKQFSPLYVNMIRAAELSGGLGGMLERVGDYLLQQLETRSMVRGAMIYPAIILVMAVTTVVFCLTFALPRFIALFAGKEALLPKPTVILMAMSGFLRTRWYIVIGVIAAVTVGLRYVIRTSWGRPRWDQLKMRLPILKRMLRALYIAQSLYAMGELVRAGAPMLDTLNITADICPNSLHRKMWQSVHDDVREGRKIAQSLRGTPLLPSAVVQMISAGEDSGTLGEVLNNVATFYSRQLQRAIKAVTAAIEPIMIIVMGAIVGFIAMSIILPVFRLSSAMK